MAQPLLKSGSVYNQEFAQRLNSSAQALRAKSAPEKQANTTASVSTSVLRARDRKQLAALTTRAPIYTAR